jgi:glycosyltransferase involved in cell wall biosynthesis
MVSIDVVIPVYNEEENIARSIATLWQFLQTNPRYSWVITIVDNGSTDNTLEVARRLSQEYPQVSCLHLDEKGRGRALRRAWLESTADIVSYMDVDLSTNLLAFPHLIEAINAGYDIAIGSRLDSTSKVTRSLKRELTSRLYNLLIRFMFFTKFHDAQCGFKAINKKAANALIPLVKNQAWFFDTELLVLAEKKEYSIKEVPVEWVEDTDSRVNVVKTAVEDIKGLLRLRFRRTH